MKKKLIALLFVIGSSLFSAPTRANNLNCWDGYVVHTMEGFPFCVISSTNEGCYYCEVAPTCP